MAIYRITRTSTPLLAPAPGSLVPGQLAVEMATSPAPRLWVGVPTNIDPTGRRLIVSGGGGGGGGGGIPEAPTDGQIYGRNGETETWAPVLPLSGGTMTGELLLYGNAIALLDAVPFQQLQNIFDFTAGPTAPTGPALPSPPNPPGTFQPPATGTLWYDTTTNQMMFYNGAAWEAMNGFLPLSGGTMQGNLILDGPPSTASNPNQAATVGYVDSVITGSLQFVGTMNAPTGTVTYTQSSGITPNPGPLVNPGAVKDSYVIVAQAGTIPATSPWLPNTTVAVGDWIISDGTQWYTILVGSEGVLASQVEVSPTILGTSDVQDALQALLTNFNLYAPINSPALTGTPTSTTPAVGDNSTRIATTAWITAMGFLTGVTLSGDVNGQPSTNLDALVMVGDITGAVSISGSGDFLDTLTLAGDSSGSNTSTLPNYITEVVLTSPDAASTTVG
jgi:hypothetical protein